MTKVNINQCIPTKKYAYDTSIQIHVVKKVSCHSRGKGKLQNDCSGYFILFLLFTLKRILRYYTIINFIQVHDRMR